MDLLYVCMAWEQLLSYSISSACFIFSEFVFLLEHHLSPFLIRNFYLFVPSTCSRFLPSLFKMLCTFLIIPSFTAHLLCSYHSCVCIAPSPVFDLIALTPLLLYI